MHPHHTSPAASPLTPRRSGVLTLSGYGLALTVERGHLVARDGLGAARRESRFHRATSRLRRVVVLGHTGYVTLDALRWLYDVGAAFIQIDGDARVLAASAALGRDVPHLRRAQAVAPWTGASRAIACKVLTRKLQGQAAVVQRVDPTVSATLAALATALDPRDPLDRLRQVEAQAAALYWHTLAPLPVHFARRDSPKVPAHWQTFGPRLSPLTGSPRNATTPAHALLNYLYALLEAEARVACLQVGLDPGLGVLHADLRNRDSLACDLMEAVRPQVDSWLLRFLAERTFAVRDFFETRTGVCRVLPPLTHTLAETLPLWAHALAPLVEQVAQMLLAAPPPNRLLAGLTQSAPQAPLGETPGPEPPGPVADGASPVAAVAPARHARRLPTPLTQTNRSAGRSRGGGVPRAAPAVPGRLSRSCLQCGAPLAGRGRLCSATCRAVYRQETLEPRFAAAGPAALAALRARGSDPSKTPEARAKVGATQRARAAARRAWERDQAGTTADPETFRRAVLPLLQHVPLQALRRATGLSLRYCSLIRRGLRVPHPQYWEPLARAAQDSSG